MAGTDRGFHHFDCIFLSFSLGASDMLILCLELIRGRLGVMSAEIRKLFFIILTTLIEKSPVSVTQLHYLFWRQEQNYFLLNQDIVERKAKWKDKKVDGFFMFYQKSLTKERTTLIQTCHQIQTLQYQGVFLQ